MTDTEPTEMWTCPDGHCMWSPSFVDLAAEPYVDALGRLVGWEGTSPAGVPRCPFCLVDLERLV